MCFFKQDFFDDESGNIQHIQYVVVVSDHIGWQRTEFPCPFHPRTGDNSFRRQKEKKRDTPRPCIEEKRGFQSVRANLRIGRIQGKTILFSSMTRVLLPSECLRRNPKPTSLLFFIPCRGCLQTARRLLFAFQASCTGAVRKVKYVITSSTITIWIASFSCRTVSFSERPLSYASWY